MSPQSRLVLALLRTHPDGLTPLEALEWGAGFRLGARVYDLRQDGHIIDREWFTTAGGARVARYVLREPSQQMAVPW